MESEEIRELRANLLKLKQEHRDLDSAINALEESGRADQLQLKRLKKKKLFLKDEIARIEDQLSPTSLPSVKLAPLAGEHEKPERTADELERHVEEENGARDPVDDQAEDAAWAIE